jgi:hypothetical protein
MGGAVLGVALLAGAMNLEGCASDDANAATPTSAGACEPEGDPVERELVDVWLPVEIDGAVCADGSQYLAFVKYARASHDLVVTFEGGGACWDYATCSGQSARGAANTDGIELDHMTALPPPLGDDEEARGWAILHPHFGVSDPEAPTAAANHVFFPYCTGDVFAGDVDVDYANPDGGEELTVRHRGRANVEAAMPWLREEFPNIGRLLVTGCSAGGVGALVNYDLLRSELEPKCGFMLDDSGPVMSETGPSKELLGTVREAWHLDGLLAHLDEELDAPSGAGTQDDFGNLLSLLSDAYPDDRFNVTLFGRDLNFSLFSYQLFYDDPPDDELYELWDADVSALRERIEELPNVGYFMPAFRPDNCSHCLSILPVDHLLDPEYLLDIVQGEGDAYIGTELDDTGLRFDDALRNLLSDEPLYEMYEEPSSSDAFDEAASLACHED